METKRTRYKPTFHPDGRKVYNPSRTELDVYDELDALTETVLADDPGCRFPELKAKEIWRQQEQAGERWKDWQQRVWFPSQNRSVSLAFTPEELRHMVDLWSDANNPISQAIAAKAVQMLK